jgi:hypothetical protein
MFRNFITDLKYVFVSPDLIINNKSIKSFLSYFLFAFLLVIVINIITIFLHTYLDIAQPENSGGMPFFQVVILWPLLEEMLFRAMLKKNDLNLSLFTGAVLNFIMIKTLNNKILIYCLTFLIVIGVYFLLNSRIVKIIKPGQYSRKQLLFLIYFSSFSFGIIHMFNYTLTLNIFYTILLLQFSKILYGFLFSMVRLKFGFFQTVCLHSFINLLGFCLYTFIN